MSNQISEGQKVFECFNLFEQHKYFFENLGLAQRAIQDFLENYPQHSEDFSMLNHFNFSFKDDNPLLLGDASTLGNPHNSIAQIVLAQYLLQLLGGEAQHTNGITTINGVWAAYAYHSLIGSPEVVFSLDTLIRLGQLNYTDKAKMLMSKRYIEFDDVGEKVITKINNATHYLKSSWVKEN